MGTKSNSCTKGIDEPEPNFGGNMIDDELSCIAQTTENEQPKPKQQQPEINNSLNLFYNQPWDSKKQIQLGVEDTEELKDNGYFKSDRPNRPSKRPEPLPTAKGNGSGGLGLL